MDGMKIIIVSYNSRF